MPQKRNPISCPILIAAATRLRDAVPTQLSAMIQEHERSVAGQPTEWLVIPEAFMLASGALRHARDLLSGLEVDAERMRANLDLGYGLLMSEAVMMGLAPKIGRGQAHTLVAAAANRAIDQGTTLREQLIIDEAVMQWLSEADLDQLLDPANYLGSTQTMIDAVLANYEAIQPRP
jgi:3-carboxy-cis,cis-muconate cycloisomerase